jgi:hypothetical protein
MARSPETDEWYGAKEGCAHRRKDSNYRNAVVALFAPAGSSQDRVVRNFRPPFVLELYADAPAHAIGIKFPIARRARSNAGCSTCCAPYARGVGWPPPPPRCDAGQPPDGGVEGGPATFGQRAHAKPEAPVRCRAGVRTASPREQQEAEKGGAGAQTRSDNSRQCGSNVVSAAAGRPEGRSGPLSNAPYGSLDACRTIATAALPVAAEVHNHARCCIGALSRHNKRYGAVVPEDSIFAERGSGSSWPVEGDLQPPRKQGHGARSSSVSTASEAAPAAAICIVMNLGKAPHHCAASSTIRRLSVSLDLRRWPSRAGGTMSVGLSLVGSAKQRDGARRPQC